MQQSVLKTQIYWPMVILYSIFNFYLQKYSLNSPKLMFLNFQQKQQDYSRSSVVKRGYFKSIAGKRLDILKNNLNYLN